MSYVGRLFVLTEDLGTLLKKGTVLYVYAESEHYIHTQVSRSPAQLFFNNFKVAKHLIKCFRLLE